MIRETIVIPVLLAMAVVGSAEASILTFDGINSAVIPDTYGDRITSTLDTNTGFEYGEGNGFTPNVVVEYLPGTGFVPFTRFTSGYGDLTNALGHQSFSVPGEVVLRPDPGYQVVLNSFDVAAWQFDRNGSVRVLDENDTVLFDTGSITLPGTAAGGHLTFPTSPIISDSALRIDINFYGDHALDNVNFDQQLVPEPTTAALLASPLLWGWLGRRRRAAIRGGSS